MGTQILFDLGYDPRAMAQFFEILAKEHKGSTTEQFFSNHPIPENRVATVNEEIRRIGSVQSNPRVDTQEFQRVKRAMLAMPEPPKPDLKAPAAPATNTTPPAAPSTRLKDLQAGNVKLRHPDNWNPAVQGTNITLAPEGGVVGPGNLAYGMLIDVFKPQGASNLDSATSQFVQGLQKSNPAMKVVRSRVSTRVDGQTAQLTELTNDSPLGGQETDVIITVMKSGGELQYFVEVAPSKDFSRYQSAFQAVMNSVDLQ
jgi:beta-barrel assembly-enhancing protease